MLDWPYRLRSNLGYVSVTLACTSFGSESARKVDAMPGLQQIQDMLERALGARPMPNHDYFWRGKTRDELAATPKRTTAKVKAVLVSLKGLERC